jgi:hypothetical protein
VGSTLDSDFHADPRNYTKSLTKQLGHVVPAPDGSIVHDPVWLDGECCARYGVPLNDLSLDDVYELNKEFRRKIKNGYGPMVIRFEESHHEWLVLEKE